MRLKMDLDIELRAGPCYRTVVRKEDIQKNIDALDRASVTASVADTVLLLDTISILRFIQGQITKEPQACEIGHDDDTQDATERQRLKQMEINCRWLMDVTDRIHDALCPNQCGTWQDRAKQAVEAAERLASNKEIERK